MKTKGTTFLDIWEHNGIAPFNSEFISTEILNYSNKCPLQAIGFYSGTQGNKKISLLEIQQVNQNLGLSNDIQIYFKFIEKLEINSNDFDIEVSKFSPYRLLTIIGILKINEILNKFGCKDIQKRQHDEENILPLKDYEKKYLSNHFNSPKDWIEFEKFSSILFNILGFQIFIEGHKSDKKRVADLYCYSPPIIKDERICLIVDCKNQDDYFINAADERAMKEYIIDKKTISPQEGIKSENIIFLFLANFFSRNTFLKVQEISKTTNTFGALLSMQNLLFLVEKKLRMGFRFYLEYFPKLFKNQEITPAQINYIYSNKDEFIA